MDPLHLAALAALALGSADRPAALESISLPGGPPVGMDYLAFDRSTDRVWVPGGNTGRIYVLDAGSGTTLHEIAGVATARRGDRVLGASSASSGGGTVYVGNRADSTVCAYDAIHLDRKGCATLSAQPDGLAYVASTNEVWATTPKDDSIAVLRVEDPSTPKLSYTVKLGGAPEGYAVDSARALFYTNLEDKDRTVMIDARSRKVTAVWRPECGEKGPRGLALDAVRQHLFVACTDGLRVLDTKDGAVLARLATGPGVDNIDFLASRRLVYVASGKDARLTIAEVAEDGRLKVVSTISTAEGCRTVVVDDTGSAYLPDSRGGRLLVVHPELRDRPRAPP